MYVYRHYSCVHVVVEYYFIAFALVLGVSAYLYMKDINSGGGCGYHYQSSATTRALLMY